MHTYSMLARERERERGKENGEKNQVNVIRKPESTRHERASIAIAIAGVCMCKETECDNSGVLLAVASSSCSLACHT